MTHKLPYRTTVGTTLNTQTQTNRGNGLTNRLFWQEEVLLKIFTFTIPRSKIIEDFSLYHYCRCIMKFEIITDSYCVTLFTFIIH